MGFTARRQPIPCQFLQNTNVVTLFECPQHPVCCKNPKTVVALDMCLGFENTSIYGAKRLTSWRHNVIRKLARVSGNTLRVFSSLANQIMCNKQSALEFLIPLLSTLFDYYGKYRYMDRKTNNLAYNIMWLFMVNIGIISENQYQEGMLFLYDRIPKIYLIRLFSIVH